MKLLFDENVSPKLVRKLASHYPGSTHVADVGLQGASDSQVWDYCRIHSFTLVSKDSDFRDRSFVKGAPPKVVWLDVKNAGTESIADLLRENRERVSAFAESSDATFLVLSLGDKAV